MAISFTRFVPRTPSMMWRILSLDVGLAILGLAITTVGLCVEAWPLEDAKKDVDKYRQLIAEKNLTLQNAEQIDIKINSTIEVFTVINYELNRVKSLNKPIKTPEIRDNECGCDEEKYSRNRFATDLYVYTIETSFITTYSDNFDLTKTKSEMKKYSDEYVKDPKFPTFVILISKTQELRSAIINGQATLLNRINFWESQKSNAENRINYWNRIASISRISGFVLVLLASVIGTKLLTKLLEWKLEARHKPVEHKERD